MNDYVELADYPNYYIKSDPPTLMRKREGKMIECSQCPNSTKDNYWIVTLYTKEGKRVKRSMHRLLMETFVHNPDNKRHINHIDGNKSNNALSNLEWCTPSENAQHAVALGLNKPPCKEVHQYYLNGTYIRSFTSDTEAEKATEITRQNISKVALGLREHAGYFQWSREFRDTLPPVKKKYIKAYVYEGNTYLSAKALATSLNLTADSIKALSKKVRNKVTTVYYD